jgi:hypothetical protein
MKTYIIKQDPVRHRKGLKSWAVFEEVAPDFRKGISAFYTMQEALKAKVELEEAAKNESPE